MRSYVCVHVRKGLYSCEATSSYEAAQKAARHWKLKSTAGIDAHLRASTSSSAAINACNPDSESYWSA